MLHLPLNSNDWLSICLPVHVFPLQFWSHIHWQVSLLSAPPFKQFNEHSVMNNIYVICFVHKTTSKQQRKYFNIVKQAMLARLGHSAWSHAPTPLLQDG